MIDTTQWRASIGAFHNSKMSVRNTYMCDKVKYDCFKFIVDEISFHHFSIVWFLSMYYVLTTFFQMSLILSGDVETNPGPVTKTCPSCDLQIHIRKKICMCGYAFNRNHLNLTSPSVNYTNTLNPVERDDTALLETTYTKHESIGEYSMVDPANEGEPEGTNKMVDAENEGEILSTNTMVDAVNEGEILSANTMVDAENEGEIESTNKMVGISANFHVGKGFLSQPSKGSVQWGKRNQEVNAKRRLQYKLNPEGKRLINQMYYSSQPETRREKVLSAYHANPSPSKRSMQEAYHSNPSPIKDKARQRAREAYNANPEKARQTAREAYSINPEKARQRKKEAYSANPEKARQRSKELYKSNPLPKRQRARNAYRVDPSPIKCRAMHSYKVKPSPVKRRALEAYYKEHEANKRKRRQLYADNRLSDRRRISKLVACCIMDKYSKLCIDKPATIAGLIYRLTKQIKGKSYIDKHTLAQYLVNTCKHYRSSHKAEFVKQFHHLRTAVLAVLAKASEAATDNEVSDVSCGPSLYTSTSESIFPDITYKSAAFDEDGNVLRHNFPSHNANASGSGTETWECSTELCAMPPKEAVVQAISATYVKIAKSDPADARDFIEHIDDCKNADTHDANLQGHNKACHVDPDACGSMLLYLRRLAPHFPNIRRIINMLYTVRRANTSLCKIDNALETENVAALEEIIKREKETKRFNFTITRDALDENQLREDNAIAINAFNARNLQLAEYPCISCMKLCFKREVTELAACIEGNAWKRLLDHYESNPVVDDGLPTGYICDYCIKKFRAGVLPARCILNGLLFENVPIEIAQLNQYEKVLIQRAKAFQVVTKMKTVAGKRLPPSHMVSKTFAYSFSTYSGAWRAVHTFTQHSDCKKCCMAGPGGY